MNAALQVVGPAEALPASHPVQAISETSAITQIIERAARDPAVDIDKMERLMAMRDRIEAQAAERAFNKAMGKAQAEMPQVLRDATNTHTKSRYARLETIARAITPVITRHGFSLSFSTAEGAAPGHHRVVCTIAHAGGHSRREIADLPADVAGAQGNANKTAIQGFGSTVSYGRRYMTLLLFNVALTNEDDDAQAASRGETITEEQAMQLRETIDSVEADEGKFARHMKVERLSDLPASRYDDAVRELKAFAARNGRTA